MLEKNLQLNDSGEEVKILQEKLKILGFFNPIISGNFFLATLEGVLAFQKEYGLQQTGIVDNEMWRMLFEYTEPAQVPGEKGFPLSFGATGAEVEELQRKLKNLLYYKGQIHAKFDLETENAVKRFQFHNNLTTTGIVTTEVWNQINTLYGTLSDCAKDNGSNSTPYITYTVVKGDSLWSIAKKYNTTVNEIKRLNNLTSDILNIGQVLKIPSSNNSNSYINYSVVKGDSLWSIARKYNTTVNEIKQLNNLTSDILNIGQVLKIPSSTNSNPYITYTVVKGDTIFMGNNEYEYKNIDEI